MGAVADITDLVMPKIKKAREEGMEKGIEKGREKGREEGKRQTALNLLKNGVSIEIISRSTGLSKEEIESLRN